MRRAIFCLTILLFSACSGNDNKNTPPIANAGEDRIVSVEQLVELDGSQSSDADGDSISFEWSILQKPEGVEPVIVDMDSAHPVFIPYEKGDYWFQLRVFDGRDWSEPDTVQFTAQATEFEPVARIRVFPEHPKEFEQVYISGAESIDPNNDPLNFSWNLVVSPTKVDFNPSLRGFFFTAGNEYNSVYRFALRVDDTRFASDYAFADIVVENTPPYADAGRDARLFGAAPPYEYQLSGMAMDMNLDPLTYEWLIYRSPQGSNPSISNQNDLNPIFTTDMQGFYVLRFRAFDGRDWSVPDYITLCNGSSCETYLSNNTISITPQTVELHPFLNVTTGKYTANLSTSGLDIAFPGVFDSEKRWVMLWCPTDTSMTVLDPNLPQSTTITFEGDINMVNSACYLRFESDTVNYQGETTYIISSSDSDQPIFLFAVQFVNNPPEVSGDDIVFKFDPSRVFQRILPSVTASDPDGDTLNYYWSIVSKPAGSQAFFSSDSQRSDPVLYVGKERNALGEYTLRVIVEDTLGGSAQRDIKLTVRE